MFSGEQALFSPWLLERKAGRHCRQKLSRLAEKPSSWRLACLASHQASHWLSKLAAFSSG